MTLLWAVFALLLLPAAWLLIAPLRGARQLHDAQHEFETNDRTAEQNVAIYRRRLASLEAALERGDIDQARFDEDRLDLERSLLEDTENLKRAPLKAAADGRIVVPVLLVLVVVASVVWYQREGAEGDLALYAAQQEVREHPQGSREMMIERLEQEAARQPGNVNVWYSLFPLYRDANRPAEALDALERLIEMEGREPSLLAQKAQLQFFIAQRQMNDEIRALVDEILELDPRQPTVLGMLGINAFDEGRYEAAIDHWRRAIAGYDDPGSAAALREGIAAAQERLGLSADEIETEVAEGPGVRVQVSLDDELRGQVDDDATVFVVAHDPDGEGPPLAVSRLLVSELPTTVTLSDANAMSDQSRISQASQARLVVRVSPSGQATPQAGDLFGDHDAVPVGATDGEVVPVVIDRVFE
ncbi:cytochrome c-type biogenesis protein CcmH [Franzmannia pantelleriensis]|uniref:Cytochrome c-type biogenesis protein CcmH n=1 Tax=Franzmannia pantelleriensis TaxID=48727 RepID=A0A1G9Q863_9GAMM|nr:c-type cytochrome biogenesis protein CcmI [Halomonas pantelleriensis]SDM06931.1 cytochrome c-type biogenesis protein CcmH [Halomonas pantelleriensis]